jgi:hypothetical protein
MALLMTILAASDRQNWGFGQLLPGSLRAGNA